MTTSNEPATKAKKVRVITDVRVIADMGTYMSNREDLATYAERLKRDCVEFVQHCRDHRSIDHIRLEVEEVVEDQCSACHRELETMNDPDNNDGRLSCANCGAEIEP